MIKKLAFSWEDPQVWLARDFLCGSSVPLEKSPLISCLGAPQRARWYKGVEVSHCLGYRRHWIPQFLGPSPLSLLCLVSQVQALSGLIPSEESPCPPLTHTHPGEGSGKEELFPSCMNRGKELDALLFHIQSVNSHLHLPTSWSGAFCGPRGTLAWSLPAALCGPEAHPQLCSACYLLLLCHLATFQDLFLSFLSDSSCVCGFMAI